MAPLRAPSVDRGVSSFLWAVVFFLFIWLGGLAVGVSNGTAFVVAIVCGCAIFLFVRVCGEDEPRRP